VGSGADVGLSLSVQRQDMSAVITIGGELGYDTAAHLRSALLQLAHENADVLVLDMTAVDFLDSTGISLLLQAKQRFDSQGAAFVLRNPPARVTRVLEVAGVADLFPVETRGGT
jgi:anti-anti-sigma factor